MTSKVGLFAVLEVMQDSVFEIKFLIWKISRVPQKLKLMGCE